MSRIINRPISVTLGPGPRGGELRPISFVYQQGWHQVKEILDTFIGAEPWWNDPNAVGRAPHEVKYWRVKTNSGGTFDLIQDGQKWTLYKSYD